MKKSLIYLTLLGIAYPLCGQAEIYKCPDENSVIYQDIPCKTGQAPAQLVVAPVRLLPPNTVSVRPLDSRAEPLPAAQHLSDALALGMSDTEVLNLRGWGRPTKIKRSKANGGWREDWIYASSHHDEQRLLQFENGKLAAMP